MYTILTFMCNSLLVHKDPGLTTRRWLNLVLQTCPPNHSMKEHVTLFYLLGFKVFNRFKLRSNGFISQCNLDLITPSFSCFITNLLRSFIPNQPAATLVSALSTSWIVHEHGFWIFGIEILDKTSEVWLRERELVCTLMNDSSMYLYNISTQDYILLNEYKGAPKLKFSWT